MDTPVTRDIGQGLTAEIWPAPDAGGIGILAFHGGGGVDGEPAMMAPFLEKLTDAAPVTVTVPRYRTLNRDKARLDAMRADAAHALAWALAQATPGAPFYVLGASFGGFLALDAVWHASEAVQRAITGLILLNPVTDTGPEGFANRVLNPKPPEPPQDHADLSPERLYAGHPLTQQMRCLVTHGGRDEVVPITAARRFAGLWPKGQARFHGVPGAGHGFFNRPPHDATVVQNVLRFMGLPAADEAAAPARDQQARPKPAAKSTPAPAAPSGALLPEGASMVYCIGAQKAGTSWLHECLTQSPDCHSQPTKELHYFDVLYHKGETGHLDERLAQLRRTVADLAEGVDPDNRKRLRRARLLIDRLSIHATTPGDHGPYVQFLLTGYRGQRLLCDFTPSYSVLDSDAFAQMDSVGPARFIFLLRDPVERFWSQIRMANSVKYPKLSDAAYLEKCVAHAQDLCTKRNPARIPRADYARTMEALEKVIPPERIHYAFYEDLFTQESVDRICAFLCIDPVPVEADKKVNLGRSSSLPPETGAMLERALAPQYAAIAARFGDAVPEGWRRPADGAAAPAVADGLASRITRLGARLRGSRLS